MGDLIEHAALGVVLFHLALVANSRTVRCMMVVMMKILWFAHSFDVWMSKDILLTVAGF